MDKIILKPQSLEDHGIWKDFEPKFSLCYNLYHYQEFFKEILIQVSLDYLKEMVTVVEYRHIFGGVFNDDGVISLDAELKIF